MQRPAAGGPGGRGGRETRAGGREGGRRSNGARRPGPRGRGSKEKAGAKGASASSGPRPPFPTATWEASRGRAPSMQAQQPGAPRVPRKRRRPETPLRVAGERAELESGLGAGPPGHVVRAASRDAAAQLARPAPGKSARRAGWDPVVSRPWARGHGTPQEADWPSESAPRLCGESRSRSVAAETQRLLSLREPGTRQGRAPAALPG